MRNAQPLIKTKTQDILQGPAIFLTFARCLSFQNLPRELQFTGEVLDWAV